MMLIANRGGCPRRAIELMGFTGKDGVDTIGRFGSGTAYAIALALRQGLDVSISSHDEDGPYVVIPYLKDVTVGAATARQIVWRYRRGSSLFKRWWESPVKALSRAWSVPSSFNLELGARDWKGAFPVVREFVSNAKDADPEHYEVWLTDEHLEGYLAEALAAGHQAVTVIRIDNPLGNRDAPEDYVESWDDYFRFGDSAAYRDGLTAIFRKPSPSPLRLFVRGVYCPWPSDRPPMSIFDYSLKLELSEARTIKDQGNAAYWMTVLWNKVVKIDNVLFAEMLRAVSAVGGDKTWEAGSINQYALPETSPARTVSATLTAWRSVHGDAPVAGPSDPKVPGAVLVTSSMRDYLGSSGVPTSLSRTVTVTTGHDHVLGPITTVVTPSSRSSMVVELTPEEASTIVTFLRDESLHGPLHDKLMRMGARYSYAPVEVVMKPTTPVSEPSVDWTDDKDIPF